MEIKSPKSTITKASDIASIMQNILDKENAIDQDKEHFWVIGLNTRNNIKYIELVSLGTLNTTIVHPREVFRMAIFKGISRLILCHNHPSGNADPSEEDLKLTKRLTYAGEIIGIEVIDHIILGDSFLSLQEKGYFSNLSLA